MQASRRYTDAFADKAPETGVDAGSAGKEGVAAGPNGKGPAV